MAALSQAVIAAVKKAGVQISRADRQIAGLWNEPGQPRFFCGFYWQVVKRGKVIGTDREGPFPCESAAIADAYKALQLGHVVYLPERRQQIKRRA